MSTPPTSDDLAERCYRLYRERIDHEDFLFSQRITWFFAVQALLLFPYIFISGNIFSPPTGIAPPNAAEMELVRFVIGVLGLGFCGVVLISCRAAHLQVHNLVRSYHEFIARHAQHKPAWLPEIQSSRVIQFRGNCTPYGGIFLFALAWTILLCATIHPWGALSLVAGIPVCTFALYYLVSLLAAK
jgi:hypothetical protein